MRRLLLCLLLAASCVPACRGQRESGADARAGAAAPGKELPGNDSRAWLSPLGSMGDSHYCATPLRLPLAREAAWRFGYTPAQFTDQRPLGLLHFDGTLAVYAACPSILLLEARSGKQLDVPFVYAHSDDAPGESVSGVFFSPQGVLAGHDLLGRYYAWDLVDGTLVRRWLSPSLRYSEMGYAAGSSLLYTGDNDGLTALRLADGSTDWVYPADRRVVNVLRAADGTVLCTLYPAGLAALEGQCGQLRWSVELDAFVAGSCIEDSAEGFYVSLTTGKLQRRFLQDGALDWEYDFGEVFTDEERRAVAALTDDRRTQRLSLAPASYSCAPEGIYLAFLNGEIMAVSDSGSLLWQRRLETPVIDCLAFPNGLLVRQAYRDMRSGGGPPQLIDAFDSDRPDWELMPPAEAEPGEGGEADANVVRRPVTYTLLRVLDCRTGGDLDRFEPDVMPVCGLVPAGKNIVFGGSRSLEDRLQDPADASPKTWFVAYDWLDEGRAE